MKAAALGVGGADIVAQRAAMVHEGHLVGEGGGGLVVNHVDQEVAEIVASVGKLAIVVVQSRVVEQVAEVSLDIADTAAAEAHNVGAVAEESYHLFSQLFGTVTVALVI